MYLLYHLVGGWVTALKLPPTMYVHWVLQLLLQCLATCALLEKLPLNVVQLTSAFEGREGRRGIRMIVRIWMDFDTAQNSDLSTLL